MWPFKKKHKIAESLVKEERECKRPYAPDRKLVCNPKGRELLIKKNAFWDGNDTYYLRCSVKKFSYHFDEVEREIPTCKLKQPKGDTNG